MSAPRDEVVGAIAAAAQRGDATIAVAESLTGGQLAAALAQGPEASTWFRGGVVAYQPEVKFEVLGVEPGPVVRRVCAEQMAAGAARVLGARVAVAVTGVGGPDDEEGQPPGTVWLALALDGEVQAELAHFDGDPGQIVEATIDRALGLLRAACDRLRQPTAT